MTFNFKPSVIDQLVDINNKLWELIIYEKDVDTNGADGEFYSDIFNRLDAKIGEIQQRGKSFE